MEKMDTKRGLLIPGLYPTGINIFTGRFTDAVCRLGAMGDSWFEYLLKQYLLVDGSMTQYSRMCKLNDRRETNACPKYLQSLYVIYSRVDLESIDALKKYVFSFVPGNDMIFVPPFDTLSKSRHITMDHLVRWKVR
jgi:mannosyl-oligosaccharide alpha-1,2-mannosidase